MLPRRIASRYAEALFSLAQEKGKTEAWEQELAAVARVITATPELHAVLTHPEIPLSRKENIITQSFQGRIAPEVLGVLMMLIKRGHDPDMQLLHEIFVEQWNAARKMMPVSVRSAVELSAEQKAALGQALMRKTGSTILLDVSVDPELIAGMVITLGDRVIDASARTALNDLRTAMRGQ